MQLSAIGRCTAASTARSSADAFFEPNAVWKTQHGVTKSNHRYPVQALALRAMGFKAIIFVRDLLALVGGKSGYVDQSPHSFGACESNDRTGISVSRYYDRPLRPVQAAVERSHVVSKRS